MLRIGLTGGIGSGKTTISKVFATLGVPVFNSDNCAKQLIYSTTIANQLIAAFGAEVYTANGDYNRKYISSLVFNNSQKLQQLNAILHPGVANAFNDFCTINTHHKYIIKESALLFEVNLHQQLNATVLVIASIETRINRVMQRDGSSHNEVMQRINNQLHDNEKIKLANYVISNNNDSLVLPQILHLHQLFTTK